LGSYSFDNKLLDKINRLSRSSTNREFLILSDRLPDGTFKTKRTISGKGDSVDYRGFDGDASFHNHVMTWSFAYWSQVIEDANIPEKEKVFYRDLRNVSLQPSAGDVFTWADSHNKFEPKVHGISATVLSEDKKHINTHIKIYDLSKYTREELMAARRTALEYTSVQFLAQGSIVEMLDLQYRFVHEPSIKRLNKLSEEVIIPNDA
jgi:hypothetical protein